MATSVRVPASSPEQGPRALGSRAAGPARVLLADRQTLVLEALRAFLASEHRVVGFARDGVALVEEARRLRPDIVVSELRLPGLDGLEAARRVLETCWRVRFVFLTSVEDEDQAEQAFAAGASGFLLKSSSGTEFLAGLRRVMQGERVLSRRIASGRPETLGLRPRGRSSQGPLSPRATEVVRLLALGHSMKEVAYELGITSRTVAYHKYGAMHALGIGSTAELVRFAVSTGLLESLELPRGA